MPPKYNSLSLGEFRLFELESSKGGEGPPAGRLRIVDVDNPSLPDFQVVSYVWSATTGNSGSILCDGEAVLAPPTLTAALRVVRHRTKRQLIWTDALCINQQDSEEKNRQVRMTPVIMSLAQAIMLYLGPESESTRAALELASQLMAAERAVSGDASRSRRWSRQFQFGKGEIQSKERQRYGETLPPPGSPAWKAMDSLLGSRAFERCVWLRVLPSTNPMATNYRGV